jgi:hypothetical protein
MRVNFPHAPVRLAADPFGDRLGLGAFFRRNGLGDICDASGEVCVPDTGTPVTVNFPSTVDCNDPANAELCNGSSSGTVTIANPGGLTTTPTAGGSATCWAYAPDGSCASYTPDGGKTVIGCGTSMTGACAPGPDYKPSSSSSSSSGGSSSSGSAPLNTTGFTNWINSLLKPGGAIAATSQGACAAAGGNWNGSVCAPQGSFALGGTVISSGMLLLVAGVAAVVLLGNKR